MDIFPGQIPVFRGTPAATWVLRAKSFARFHLSVRVYTQLYGAKKGSLSGGFLQTGVVVSQYASLSVQEMHTNAVKKFQVAERHFLLHVAVALVFVTECDFSFCCIYQTVVTAQCSLLRLTVNLRGELKGSDDHQI